MAKKNSLLIGALALIGGFFIYKKIKSGASATDEAGQNGGGNNFELPPEYTGQGRGGASAVVPFSEPVSVFIPPGATSVKAPTSTTEMPQTPEQLAAIANDIRQKWLRWKTLIDTPIISGIILPDYNVQPGPPVANPIYLSKLVRNSLNTPLPNIALIPNLMVWNWNPLTKYWQISERTA